MPVSSAGSSKSASQQSTSPAKGSAGGGIELLTDTEGVDFNSYLRDVSLSVIASSNKSDFDAASLHGIQEAAPFKHLPEKFSKPFIVLRFTFYYNVPIPQNPK
jgi:hypothetical protein